MREVKAQPQGAGESLGREQLGWSGPLAAWLVRHSANCLSRYRILEDGKTAAQRRQAVEFGEKAASLPVAARREGRVTGDTERMMDGIFVGHHYRIGAPLFLSERGFQRKTADQQWDNEFIRKCRGVPWMLIREEPEVRPQPAPAVVMLAPEAIVRTPQQRRWYILKQDVARYGPTPGFEACVAQAGGAQRVTKPHSDECRARMDELM